MNTSNADRLIELIGNKNLLQRKYVKKIIIPLIKKR